MTHPNVPSLSLADYLRRLPNRCEHGFHKSQAKFHDCTNVTPTNSPDEWAVFKAALLTAAVDGIVHQSAVRPMIRGRVAPKHIGTYYRRAKAEGLLRDTGEREPSNDIAGRNQDKLDRIYALEVAA